MGKYYKTDISPEQFELIREDLEAAKKTARSRKYLLYDIFLCFVVYFKNWMSMAQFIAKRLEKSL